MEGSYTAHPGDWINFGWHYTPSISTPYSMTWINPTAAFIYKCSSKGSSLTWTMTFPATTYTDVNHPASDEHEVWQDGFAAQLPALCGEGAPIYSTTSGGAFVSSVCSTVAMKISTQWHYRIPGAKGGTAGNVQLAKWCPANKSNGQYGSTCGASWSATKSTTISACSSCSTSTLATSPFMNSGDRTHSIKWASLIVCFFFLLFLV